MSARIDPSQSNRGYVFDPESGTELARLINQDRLLAQSLGGLLPEDLDLS